MTNKPTYEELEKRVKELEHLKSDYKKAEEDFALIFTMSLDMICIADINSAKFIKVNPAFTDILGYSEKELLAQPFFKFIHPDDVEPTKRAVEEKLQAGSRIVHFENRYRSKDGSYRWLSWVSHPNIGTGLTYAIARDITESKQYEEKLKEKKLLLDATGRMAKVGGWELDAKTLEVSWTEETYRIHEVPPGYELPLHKAVNFFHSNDRPQLEKAIQRALMHGESYDLEVRFITAKGNKLWTRTICKPLIENGNVVKLQGTFQDITDRKEAEAALRVSEERLNLIIKGSNDAPWDWDLVNNDLYYSPQWWKQIGFKPNEIEADASFWQKRTHPDDVERINIFFEDALKHNIHGYEVEFRLLHKAGHYVSVLSRGFISRDKNGVPTRVSGTNMDLSERKKNEQALAAEKERLLVTLRSIGDGVITTDIDGRVVLINTVAEELTGWNQLTASGKDIKEVFNIINAKTKQRCDNPVEKVLEAGAIVGLANHTNLISRDGKERMIADSGAPIFDKDSQIIGVVLVFRDVTNVYKTEQKLLQAQKMDAIGILAGGIAHDFNNLLGVITGNISYALSIKGSGSEMYEVLTDVQNSTKQAQGLTRQLLTFSKGGTPVKKVADLNEIIKDTAIFVSHGEKSRCEFEFARDLWTVEVDPDQINQVISNLIINANQSMPEGGAIRVKTENFQADGNNVIPLDPGKYVRIMIEDQGIGISEAHHSRIFDPYFSTKQKGSGLGLSTTYSVIKQHDGHISVYSEVNKGTVFHIYLPATIKEYEIEKRHAVTDHRGCGRILIMDDQKQILKMVERILNRMGYETAVAEEGARAVELYQNAVHSGSAFDLVILDLTVPGGMGGAKTMEELLKTDPNVKAVVSSGYSNDPVMANYEAYGFCGVVPKPYTKAELSEVLNNVLGEKG